MCVVEINRKESRMDPVSSASSLLGNVVDLVKLGLAIEETIVKAVAEKRAAENLARLGHLQPHIADACSLLTTVYAQIIRQEQGLPKPQNAAKHQESLRDRLRNDGLFALEIMLMKESLCAIKLLLAGQHVSSTTFKDQLLGLTAALYGKDVPAHLDKYQPADYRDPSAARLRKELTEGSGLLHKLETLLKEYNVDAHMDINEFVDAEKWPGMVSVAKVGSSKKKAVVSNDDDDDGGGGGLAIEGKGHKFSLVELFPEPMPMMRAAGALSQLSALERVHSTLTALSMYEAHLKFNASK